MPAKTFLKNYIAQFQGFDRRIYTLALGWLITAAGFAMIIPFISIYFYQELGISLWAIGVYFGCTAVLRAAPQPFAGWLSDRFGRVPVMAWSQILRAMTFLAVSIAIYAKAGFLTIGGIIGINFIFGSVLHPAANAMVADIVKRNERIEAYSLLRISGNLGWAIGPGVGGMIAYHSYFLLFLTAAVMATASGLYFLFVLKDVKIRSNGEHVQLGPGDFIRQMKNKLLMRHCIISFILFLAVAQLIAALSIYSVEMVGISKDQLGKLYLINGSLVVLFQFYISTLFKRLPLTRQLALGAAIYAIGYFMVGLAGSFSFLILCMIIITTAEMIVSPPAVTFVANISPPEKYGQYMGIFGFFQMAGWSLGPTVGGALLHFYSAKPIIMWSLISSLALIACISYLVVESKISKDVNSSAVDQVSEHA